MNDASEMLDDWNEDRDRQADWMAERLDTEPADFDPGDDLEADPDDDRWQVDDDHAAEWALKKLAKANRELERVDAIVQEETSRLRQWQDEVSQPLVRSVKFFEGRLIDYRRRLEAEDPDLAKTYRLPGGELIRRAGRAKALLADPEQFCEWALAHERTAVSVKPLTSAVTRSKRFSVTDTGELVDRYSGEFVPGIRMQAGSDSYGVKLR